MPRQGRLIRLLAVTVVPCAALALAATSASALELSIPAAREKTLAFAEQTCDRDRQCVRHGVTNCRRERRRVVFCRMFLQRKTDVQGTYHCSRLVRLGIRPKTHRVPVTGLSRWHC